MSSQVAGKDPMIAAKMMKMSASMVDLPVGCPL
jgi:hypothetical protein